MSFNVSNRDSRDIYETAAKMIASANGVSVKEIDKNQLTQGYVETHANLSPNSSVIQWPIVDTQQISGAPITPLMRLLSMQDSFVVGSMSYFLMIYYFVGNQQTPDYSGANYFTPITYVQKQPNFYATFAAAGDPQNVAFQPGVSLFWNGYLSYEVDKKVIIPYWNCSRHYYVPQTQAQALFNPANNQPYTGPTTTQQYDGSTDTFYPVEPTIVMGGGRQNVWKLNLPANVPGNIEPFNQTGYGVNWYLKACLRFHGILAQNSTSVK